MARSRKTKLARLREDSDWTLRDIAAIIGCSPATYYRLENYWTVEKGQRPQIRLQWLVHLSLLYNVHLPDVIEEEWLQWDADLAGPFDPADRRLRAPYATFN